ncbi:MAG: phosphoribosylformylglycinamidine synthase subunit PurS [Verrucomicrobiae bacterium]|nr:phosphoribosylformylglycinamidine synthase subunit PurS [Verrucomicrobiae bacterium]
MKALIAVMPKRTVLDPQGEAVKEAIHHLGFEAVKDARVGKFIELKVEGMGEAEARRRLEVICHELLSNPVIEEYSLLFDRGADGKAASPKAGAGRGAKGAKARAAAKAARKSAKSKPKGRRARR